MADLTTVARPYASAAFEFAVANHAVARWSDMLAFCASVAADPIVQSLLVSGERAERVAEIFLSVVEDQVDAHGANLIKIMAENGRLAAVPVVATMFEAHRAEFEKVADVAVTSSMPLSNAQEQQIVSTMEKRLGRKVKLSVTIDAALIGGVVIQAGDIVIDGSVRGQLERLTETLQA
ncbi:MAG: F0F1 ATP synthase subunit delta [Gammaproteobacteria bacterium]|nr:F0F1 ATP synthase subunit delta [Gammaproteobacteria bacterium]